MLDPWYPAMLAIGEYVNPSIVYCRLPIETIEVTVSKSIYRPLNPNELNNVILSRSSGLKCKFLIKTVLLYLNVFKINCSLRQCQTTEVMEEMWRTCVSKKGTLKKQCLLLPWDLYRDPAPIDWDDEPFDNARGLCGFRGVLLTLLSRSSIVTSSIALQIVHVRIYLLCVRATC